MPAHPMFTNFTGGAVTEKLDARVDSKTYQNSARVVKNGVVLPQGGVASRAGTIYVGAVKDPSSRVRVYPFTYSATVAYTLEIGAGYIRFWKDRAPVMDGAVPAEVATTYTVAELRELRFEQSADILYIGHPEHAPAKLIRTSATTFELHDVRFFPPPTHEPTVAPSGTLTLSTTAPGTATATASVATFLEGDLGRQISEFATGAGRAVISAYVSTTEVTIEILDTFSTTGPLATGEWVLDGTANAGTVLADGNGKRWSHATITASVGAFRASDVGKYIHFNSGIAKILSVTFTTEVKAQILKTILDHNTATPAGNWTVEVLSWSAAFGYPGVPCLHQQRLWWAGSPTFLDYVWGSVTADYENHGRGALDDQAIVYQLATAGVNQVRWMRPGSAMGIALGTVGSELTLDGGTDAPITPSSVHARERTAYGADYTVDAIKIDNQQVFLQRGGTRVREFTYSMNEDNFNAPDISIMSEHLFRSQIVEFAYSRSPESLIFALRADGLLNLCTYERAAEVLAWSYAQLTEDDAVEADDDTIESITVVPNFCGTGDEVWIATVRTTVGADYWATDFWATDFWAADFWAEGEVEYTARYLEVFDGQMSVDAGLTWSGAAASTFTGLGHLEGRTARVVVANGDQYNIVVESGQVVLPDGATTTQVEIGLPWVMTIVTVRPELALQNGTAQGRRKRWNEVTVRVFGTKGNILLNGEILDYPEGTDTDLFFSGDMKRKTDFGWDRDGLLVIQRPDSKPCTITGITGALTVADD